jgi:hypothetical protein
MGPRPGSTYRSKLMIETVVDGQMDPASVALGLYVGPVLQGDKEERDMISSRRHATRLRYLLGANHMPLDIANR